MTDEEYPRPWSVDRTGYELVAANGAIVLLADDRLITAKDARVLLAALGGPVNAVDRRMPLAEVLEAVAVLDWQHG